MEFQIDQAVFLDMLNLAQTVAERRSSMPVLSHVLLDAQDGGNVSCSATDMILALTRRADADVRQAGGLVLAAKTLCDMVRTLPPGPVHVQALDNHWAKITSGRSEFKLTGMAPADFPELPEAGDLQGTTMSAAALADMIARTAFAISTDEMRTNLNGALFESDGSTVTMVATDGHRLTKFTAPMAGPTLERSIVIPRKGILELRRVLDASDDEIELGVQGSHLFARTPALTLAIKLNDVAFPPHDRVIPRAYQRRVVAEREPLLSALNQAAVMAPEKTSTVRLHIEPGSLELAADNPVLGQAHQQLEIEYDGDPLTAGFNARYLIDMLRVIQTDKVALEFQGELDPCVIRPEGGPDYLGVVMPMRI